MKGHPTTHQVNSLVFDKLKVMSFTDLELAIVKIVWGKRNLRVA